MWRSESDLTALKTKPKETFMINGQIEDMQSYFEEICESFAARKQYANQIVLPYTHRSVGQRLPSKLPATLGNRAEFRVW